MSQTRQKIKEIFIPSQAFCRCCHGAGNFRSLSECHNNQLIKNQSYAELLQGTFCIYLKAIESKPAVSSWICDTCIVSLVEATSFKNQVLNCEKILTESCAKVEYPSTSNYLEIKNELSQTDNDNEEKDVKLVIQHPETGSPTLDSLQHQTLRVGKLKRVLKVERTGSDEDWDGQEQVKETLDIKSRPFACSLCHKSFTFQGYLDAHHKTHTGGKTFKCEICQNTFPKNKELTKHIEINHVQNKKYPCVHCTHIFITAQLLKKHLTSHSSEKQFQCQECQKQFKRKRGLTEHMLTHSGVKKYKCQICQKCFGHNQTLKSHLLTHSGERPYICDVCGRRFPQRTHLKRHIHIIHTGVKPYTCQTCQKQFSSKSYLSVHERQHTGDKPYSCEYCKKPFAAYTTLKVHLRVHTGLKPYTCNICGRSFAQVSSLRIHERSHSGQKPFSCDVCKKSFSDNGYLKIHLRTHSGVKPYTCTVCQKSFKDSGQLKKHSNTHASVKPYTCKVCNKQIGNVYKHMRLHSNVKNNCR